MSWLSRTRLSARKAMICLLASSMVSSGCGGGDETAAVSQLREMGALVVLDVNKKASSIVLPSDEEKVATALPLLEQLSHLTSVGAINSPITDDALKTIGRLKTLTNVDVSGTGITDEGVRHLTGLSKLSSLNLADTKVTSKCLADVGRLRGVEMLNLANTNLKGGFEKLHGCRDLSWLVLANVALSDEDAAALAGHPNLKRVSASDGVQISTEAASLFQAKAIQIDLSADAGQAGETQNP